MPLFQIPLCLVRKEQKTDMDCVLAILDGALAALPTSVSKLPDLVKKNHDWRSQLHLKKTAKNDFFLRYGPFSYSHGKQK